MKIIRKSILLTCFFTFISTGLFSREEISLDGQWKFALERDHKDFTDWMNGIPFGRLVSVPHTWNIEDGNERLFGKAWYEKEIMIPGKWKEKQVRLFFDAVYRDAIVYLNGKKVGEHIGSGFTEFSFNVTKFLKYNAENKLLVSVDNHFSEYALPYKDKFDWSNDGGIIRPVHLAVTGNTSICYARVRPEINFNEKTAHINLEIKNWEYQIKRASYHLIVREWKSKKEILNNTVALSAENNVFKTTFELSAIKLWHFDDPNLYTLDIEIIVNGKVSDLYSTRFGLRKLEIKGNQLFLNEEAVRLPGIEYMPGSHPDFGMAEDMSVMQTAVDQMKELNCLITRCHWQYDKRFFDLLDEKGILAQEEIPWWQAPGNLSIEMESLAKSQINEMIERDFNHPSIVSWGVSNEVFYNTDKDIYRRLIHYAKDFRSDRFITVVSNEIFDRLENDESLLADIPTWNDYVGTWHGKNREETPEKLALINSRALKGRPLLITEHGLCEPRFVGGDARRVVEMAYHYDQWAKNKYIIGAIYFSLNDYRTHVGEAGFGRYKSRVHGLSSMWFDRKPSFYVYKGLAAPVYFEDLHIAAKGNEAQVVLAVKDNLPSYTLRGYLLRWKTTSGLKEIKLPDLKPGEKFTLNIDELDKNSRPVVSVYRPTGYMVNEY